MHMHPPAVIPGMVVLQYIGEDSAESGEKHNHYVNVFPVDARELVNTGKYVLVDNGAAEASRLNSTPLRAKPAAKPAPKAEPAPAPAEAKVEAPAETKPAAPANPARK